MTPQETPEASRQAALEPSPPADAPPENPTENATPPVGIDAPSSENESAADAALIAPSETFSRVTFLRDSAPASEAAALVASTRAPAEAPTPSHSARAEKLARRGAKSEVSEIESTPDKVRQNALPNAPRDIFDTPRVLAQNRYLRMLGALLWPCLIVMLLAYAWHPLSGGDDVWAHASIGSWIWQRQQVPRESLFLWGAPPIPWVWHSWLSQLSFYGLMRFGALFQKDGGPYAIATFTVAVIALCYVLLWKNWRRHAPLGSVCAMMFFAAIFAGVLRYRPRPELFTALFLVLLMLWLDAWWRDHSARATSPKDATPRVAKTSRASTRGVIGRVLLLGAMFALWANFHGAVLLGLVLLFATALCDLWQSRADKNRASCF